jgi:ADP-L-glycero-D-manno-heptose 6-epimerase
MQHKKIIVTGGAGFIGSNIIAGLNKLGIENIIVVDNLQNAQKFKNIVDLKVVDFMDKRDFIALIEADSGLFSDVDAIFHEGACSDTMEHNGMYMMKNNFEYSKYLYLYCQKHSIPLMYASSAATYGNEITFIEDPAYEKPLNVYGYSKLLFDNYLRNQINLGLCRSQVVGFRYFNVYGPREFHKGKMASVAFHHYMQYKDNKQVKLFGEYAGYAAGQHTRDFVFVDDIVHANLFMLENPHISGIFNLGTGLSEPFNNVAHSMLNASLGTNFSLNELIAQKYLEYIDFPALLEGKYQSYTQANIEKLRNVGYTHTFATVAQGIQKYYVWLEQNTR